VVRNQIATGSADAVVYRVVEVL